MLDKKVGILIAWPREIDIFKHFFYKRFKNNFEFIINDTKSKEKGRQKSNQIIKSLLKRQKVKFKLFSEIYKKKKYRVIISTGEINADKANFLSILKFIYSNLIGRVIEYSGIYKILIKLFGKPFTANVHRYSVGHNWYPEKEIGKIVVKYPDGADLKLKNYPYDEYKSIFDIYFSYSDLDLNLIKRKFERKKCLKILFFRHEISRKKNTSDFINEFDLNKKKKTVLWIPTHINVDKEEDQNILLWANKLSVITENYNLIIRPHPKSLLRNQSTLSFLKKNGLKIDVNFNRDINHLLTISDLIITDYGGIIYDTLYLKKNIILLNMPSDSKYVKELVDSESIDIKIRKKLINLKLNDTKQTILRKIQKSFDKDYKKKITLSNYYVFGKDKGKDLGSVINFLNKNV